MNLNNSMKYIESEYSIINTARCKLCDCQFIQLEFDIQYIENIAHDIYYCACENCGSEKIFAFAAPYISNIDDEIFYEFEVNNSIKH